MSEMSRSEKLARLDSLLRECAPVCIGYSGGVDSVFLTARAVRVLGNHRVLAVTGISASYPAVQRGIARECAARLGVSHLEVATHELDDERYLANPSNRCYFCKSELWPTLLRVARERGYTTVLDGSNADDAHDYRPGFAAAQEHGIRSPLLEAGLTKAEIRGLSRELGLPTWDQPAAPCLSSRLPYGVAVTVARLQQVESAEDALRALGFHGSRVRHHADAARVEVTAQDITRAVDAGGEIFEALREAGFDRVLLDVEGYRQGALNEALVQLGRTKETEDVPPHDVAGQHGDIAVIASLDPERVRADAAALRRSGFRYIAIDLAQCATHTA